MYIPSVWGEGVVLSSVREVRRLQRLAFRSCCAKGGVIDLWRQSLEEYSVRFVKRALTVHVACSDAQTKLLRKFEHDL